MSTSHGPSGFQIGRRRQGPRSPSRADPKRASKGAWRYPLRRISDALERGRNRVLVTTRQVEQLLGDERCVNSLQGPSQCSSREHPGKPVHRYLRWVKEPQCDYVLGHDAPLSPPLLEGCGIGNVIPRAGSHNIEFER